MKNMRSKPVQGDEFYQEFLIKKMDLSTGGLLIMSQPDGLLILGDHPFLNYIFFFGQRGFTNTAGFINPNLTLYIFG